MDDQYTLLYKEVIDKNEPKKFFTLYRNQVKSIKEFINNPIKDFSASDMIFTYFESLIDKEEFLKFLNVPKKVVDFDLDWQEYSVSELKKIKPKLKLAGTVIYYAGDINKVINDKNLANLIVTEEQFELAKLIYNLNVSSINQYKNQFIEYRNIVFDKQSLINEYFEWVKNNQIIYQSDLDAANTILAIQKYLNKNISLKTSDEVLDKLVKYFNPLMNERDVDRYDGLDLFNQIALNEQFYYLVYKNYYKIHDSMININVINVDKNTLHIEGKTALIDYQLSINLLKVEYFKESNLDFLNLNLGEPVNYSMNGYFSIYNIQVDESKLLSLILTHPLLQLIFFNQDNVKNLSKPYYNIKYIPYKSNHIISIKLAQNSSSILVKFKNVYDIHSFKKILTLLLSKATTKTKTQLNELLSKITFKKEKEKDSNLSKLQILAPEVFVEGYAAFCDKKKRPTPIEEDEVKPYLKRKMKELDLEDKKNLVLNFETEHQILHLVCDYDNDIYPYLKDNKKLNNKELYELLPCCGAKPYKVKKEKKTSHLTNINIVLSEKSTGELPFDLNYFLSNYRVLPSHFKRLGVVNDGLSLLHCCCVAVQDERYLSNKEYYVKNLRLLIADKINASVAQQQLYDIDDIKNAFLNDSFLDPKLYFRYLEEYFNLNIVVFDDQLIKLPRFKLFYARPERNRPTLLIYQHQNQCELIMNNEEYLYGEDMTHYCHLFLQQKLTTFTFSNIIYKNLYYYTNYLSFINYKKMEQFIDSYGKMRALILTLSNNTKLSLLTIPSEPENLPIASLERANLKDVLKIMTQEPTGISRYNNQLVGLWYRMFDVEHAIYIPIIPTVSFIDKIVLKEPELTLSADIIKTNYFKIKKQFNLILEVIYWLYAVGMYQFNLFDNIENFFDNYIMVKKTDYDIQIPRRLPTFNRYSDYFNYVNSSDQFILDPELVEGVKKRLFYFDLIKQQQLTEDEAIIIPIVINNYYQYIDDFKSYPKNVLFLDLKGLEIWLHQRQLIYKTIIQSPLPYLYQAENGQMAIIKPLDKVNLTLNPTIYKVENNQLVLVKKGSDDAVVDYVYRPNKIGQYALINFLL